MNSILTYESFLNKIFRKKKVYNIDISKLKEDVEYLIQSLIDDYPGIRTDIKEASIKLEDNRIRRPKFDIIASGSVLGDGEPNISFVYGEKNCIALQAFCSVSIAKEFLESKKDTIESMNLNYEMFPSTLSKVWILFWYNT